MLSQYFYALLATAVTHAVLSAFVYLKGRNRLTNRTYAAYSMAIALWSAGEAFSITALERGMALWLWRLNHIGVIFIPIFFVHFVTSLLSPREAQRRKVLIRVSYIVAISFLIMDFTGVLIAEVVPKFHFNYFINATPIYPFFFFSWVAWALYGLAELFRLYFQASPVKRNQLSYFAVSMLVAYIGGIPNFLPTFGIEIPFLMPFGTYAIPIYGLFTAYAIARYRLLDIRLAFTRTTIFLLLYFLILGIPSAAALWGREWLTGKLGDRWWLLPLGLFGTLSTAGPFLYLMLQRKAEEQLLKEQRRYQQTLLQASRGMTLIKDLNRLLRLIVHLLTRTIQLTHASIFLLDQNTNKYECKVIRGFGSHRERAAFETNSVLVMYLKRISLPIVSDEIRLRSPYEADTFFDLLQKDLLQVQAAVVIPSFIRDRLIGFLVLGEKKSGEIYTQADLNTLVTLANQAALAIENCEFLKETERTQLQLFQAAKMADLGTMASGIGHQMNNRLNIIKMGADSVMWADLPSLRQALQNGTTQSALEVVDKIETSLKRASESAKRGSDIVRRLLDFSKLSEGFKEVSLPEALKTCIELWEWKRDLSLIQFENKIPADIPSLWGNFSQIEEVLFNLLDNAYDAIEMKKEEWEFGRLPKPPDPERGRITVSARPFDKDGKQYVEILVEENGVGMAPETQKQIFVPFFTTKATAIKGTGLGLYVIKRMVAAHGGEISVESEYGKGTTFHLFLPTKKGEGT